ncbi:MAG: esterase-like activity of phytase family protein [Bacteroidetes bacterium]|nr:esterase-like activity of phytase family protein [Bacteroidota bacterium]
MQRVQPRTILFIIILCVLRLLVPLVANAQPAQVMQFTSRYINRPAALDKAACESVAYDAATKTAVFTDANVNKISFVNLANPTAPVLVRDVLLSAYGGMVNSVAIKNGLVAVAIEDGVLRQNPGKVLFFTTAGVFQNVVIVGAIPDQVTFTPDGSKLIVCNEGEPSNDYLNDPEGSVSIVSLSGGVMNATTQTVGFTTLNTKRDSLKALGVRFLGPNSVAQDLEPEYATVTADGKTAYVTLQEANAMATIDIPTATLTKIVSFGYKDHSKGLPRVQQFPLANLPILGRTTGGQDIRMGGFSGLWFEGFADVAQTKLRFLTHPDRGPNAEPTVLRGSPRRPFALPNMQEEVIRFELDKTTGAYTILDRIPLFRTDGITPISGRPNLQAAGQGMAYTDEYGVDLFGNDIPNDAFGGDLEGIATDANGTWWMVDEYRPAIYNFQANGTLIARYIPQGTAAAAGAAAGTYGTEILPAVYGQRRSNRGFEAVAIEGTKLYAFIQSPIDNPDDPTDKASKASTWCRIIEFDIVTKTVTGEYLYPMFEKALSADKIGDATSLGNGKFLVVERDDATGLKAVKYIWEINLRTASNLLTTSYTLPVGRSLESLTFAELAGMGIRPVAKRKAVYLPGAGYGNFDKVEGLAKIDNNTFLLVNDNDFGIGGSVLPTPPNGLVTINPSNIPVIGLLTFDRPNGLDPSDRDGGTFIGNWPVFGTYMPDAISNFTVNGQTFLVTANEGDARDFTTPPDEFRINASTVILDPIAFPNAATLKTDAQLGRLRISVPSCDLDGDGDLDELHAYGARSFTIWNTDGNQIWDSGSEFETRIAATYPANFNASHASNTADARSPNKGPEPEGITVGTIGDSIYVFVGLERMGHTMMYNVTNPVAPRFTDYINTRDLAVTPSTTTIDNGTVGDLGPEVVAFIPSSESPNGNDLLLTGNEVSGTMSVMTVRIPRLRSQPPAAIAACIGDALPLQVTATGPSLTYQWQFNGVDIVGATASTYTPLVTTTAQAGSYRCNVRAAGGMVITSSPTQVSVSTRTTIIQEPVAFTQIDEGTGLILRCDATSTAGETYQWYKAGVALTDGASYSGSRTKALKITSVQFADTSSAYYCVVTGGCSSARTRNAAVLIPRILVSLQPQGATVCPGDTLVLRTAAMPSGGDVSISYQWRRNGEPLRESSRAIGVTTPTLRLQGVTQGMSGEYTCLFIGSPSREPYSTSAAHVEVSDVPVIITHPQGNDGSSVVSICETANRTFTVVAAGPVAGYQWLLNGQPIVGATDPFYTATTAGAYSVQVKGRCNTTVVRSTSVELTEVLHPEVRTQPKAVYNVEIGTSLALTVTLKRGTAPIRYQWYKNGSPIAGATMPTYELKTIALQDGGTYQCRVSNSCATITTDGSLLTVRQPVSVSEEQRAASAVWIEPNPFVNEAVVHFTMRTSGRARLTLTDLHGGVVASLLDADLEAGAHTVQIRANDGMAAGMYAVRIERFGTIETQPVILVR